MDKSRNLKWKILGIIVILCILCVFAAGEIFRVEDTEVTGNSFYSKEEIEELVMGEHKNSLYLAFLYNYKNETKIQFIDKVEVTMISAKRIKIRVYEKPIIGYVEYMGSNLYFDKDGTVVETADRVLEGIPLIKGLQFDTLALNQPLDVENPEIFPVLLSVMQMMKKYELNPDAINLRNNGSEIVLVFENVRINLGKGENLDEKAAEIKMFFSELEGKSGELDMKEYTKENPHISFLQD